MFDADLSCVFIQVEGGDAADVFRREMLRFMICAGEDPKKVVF